MRGHEIDLVDDLREALHSAPLVVFRNQDPATIVQLGRRRRRTRRLLAAGVVAALAVSVAVAIRPLGTTAVTPATDRTGTKVQTPEEDAAWQAWADCLRQAEVPGVVVTGPEPGDGTIGYTDTQGDPLPRNYREENPNGVRQRSTAPRGCPACCRAWKSSGATSPPDRPVPTGR